MREYHKMKLLVLEEVHLVTILPEAGILLVLAKNCTF